MPTLQRFSAYLMRKKLLVSLLLALWPLQFLSAQDSHVSWACEYEKISDNLFELTISAKPESGWHIYDIAPNEGGPIPTSIVFKTKSGETPDLVGSMEVEAKLVSHYDRDYMAQVGYYDGPAKFTQKLRTKTVPAKIVVELEWMACSDANCEPPSNKKLEITLY